MISQHDGYGSRGCSVVNAGGGEEVEAAEARSNSGCGICFAGRASFSLEKDMTIDFIN